MSQTSNTTRNSFIGYFRKQLQAGQDIIVNVTGRFLICTDVEGGDGEPFLVSIDDGAFVPFNLGLKVELPHPDSFSKVAIRNPSQSEITVEFYAGSILVEDMRLNIVRGRAAPIMKAETVLTSHGGTIAGGGVIDLSDLVAHPPPNPKYLRAATIVTNMDPGVDLDILNTDDAEIGTCFFRQSLLIESSDPIKVKNSSGGNVICRIAQAWYVIR